MWQAIRLTFGSVWLWMVIIGGAMALFNFGIIYLESGSGPILDQILVTYRAIVHVGIDYLFFWTDWEMSPALKDVLAAYFLLVTAGVRLELGELTSRGEAPGFAKVIFAFLQRMLVSYPLLIAFPGTIIITLVLLIIDPAGFVLDVPGRLGIEDNQVAWFFGGLLIFGGFVGTFKRFKDEVWVDKNKRNMFVRYLLQLAFVGIGAFVFVAINSGL